ncbi:MAG: DUF3147 family protein [Candidatus Shapirobacteria bacterium]|jgi:hypothetical protein
MDKLFLIKLILSFFVGGSYIAFTIWVSEKFGSKIGGILIGMPSTFLISLIFLAWTQSSQIAASAVPIVPAILGATSIFLVVLIYFYKFNKIIAFIIAFCSWFILSFPLVFFSLKNIWISLVLAVIFLSLAIFWLSKFPHKKLDKFILTRKEFLFRIIFVGGFIMFIIFLGKILGPFWGLMFANFPVVTLSSFFILERKHGIEFASSVARTIPYGTASNVLFALTFFILFPIIGFILAIIIAYLISLIFAFVVNKFILKK